MPSPEDKGGSETHVSLFRAVKMVAWAFLGIRKGSESLDDVSRTKPIHIIFVGVGLAAVFVFGLIFLVQWVVAP